MCNKHSKESSLFNEFSDKTDSVSTNTATDLDKYVESFDKILSNIGALTNAVVDVSVDAGRDLNEKAREWSSTWLFNPRDADDDVDGVHKPHFFNFPPFYQNRDPDLSLESRQLPLSSLWRNSFGARFPSLGSTPFGYRAYKGPSTRQYNECLDKQGRALWDDQGYWRCLFPEAEVPVDVLDFKKKYFGDSVVSKDDFFKYMSELGVSDSSKVIDLKDKGTFFNTYEDYLAWRHEKYSEMKKKREEDAKARAAKRSKVLESLKQKQGEASSSGRYVTSTSVKSNVFTDSDTNEVKYLETRQECFNDGNCVVTKVTKSKPIGATDWVNVEEHTESTPTGSGANKGWFWK
ncbi:hypothetical protein KGF57_005263 [Candida theae]|uniref:Uncharacterized protein n=1 Tax=Candida theae TaxID=1198502 RepID=A0AAD5FW92_9ASCO|nr:uncharacterized protein KGF57_005263 [Candida theae]KAI5948865.1 hypothetical protein KGF57_005263 [Candida theae]